MEEIIEKLKKSVNQQLDIAIENKEAPSKETLDAIEKLIELRFGSC